jgi:adenylate kinase
VNIILFGPPGAGKGTQANNIVKAFKLLKVSTGDLLRNEVQNNTNLGNIIKPLIEKGSFVSDEIINTIITKILADKKHFNRLIFDGYPRNINQAKNFIILLKKYNQKISCALSLDVDKETLIKRIAGRQLCTKCKLVFNKYFSPATNENHKCDPRFLDKRTDDDDEKIIAGRYEDYLKKTLPILSFYKDLNLLHHINGKGDISEIFEEIRVILTSLDA